MNEFKHNVFKTKLGILSSAHQIVDVKKVVRDFCESPDDWDLDSYVIKDVNSNYYSSYWLIYFKKEEDCMAFTLLHKGKW